MEPLTACIAGDNTRRCFEHSEPKQTGKAPLAACSAQQASKFTGGILAHRSSLEEDEELEEDTMPYESKVYGNTASSPVEGGEQPCQAAPSPAPATAGSLLWAVVVPAPRHGALRAFRQAPTTTVRRKYSNTTIQAAAAAAAAKRQSKQRADGLMQAPGPMPKSALLETLIHVSAAPPPASTVPQQMQAPTAQTMPAMLKTTWRCITDNSCSAGLPSTPVTLSGAGTAAEPQSQSYQPEGENFARSTNSRSKLLPDLVSIQCNLNQSSSKYVDAARRKTATDLVPTERLLPLPTNHHLEPQVSRDAVDLCSNSHCPVGGCSNVVLQTGSNFNSAAAGLTTWQQQGVFVGDLCRYMTEYELYKGFVHCRKVHAAWLCRQQHSRASLGYEYVVFEGKTAGLAVKRPVELDGQVVQQQPICVKASTRSFTGVLAAC